MNKTKFFESDNIVDLEAQVNDWLDHNKSINVIHVTMSPHKHDGFSDLSYCIFYKTNNP